MKRKNLIKSMMIVACAAAVTMAVPVCGMAAETEMETEAEITVPDYPEYKASDYVTLGEYKGLALSPVDISVSEEEIQQELAYYVQLADAMERITEGTVQEGDTANIDYEGKKDDVAFDGGTAKGYDLGIGTGTFIPGFEEGLVGVAIGDTVDLPLTFPENYGNTELAGKDVVFTVTVNEVKRMPELTDDLVNTISSGEYSDVESYKDYLKAEVEQNKQSSIEAQQQYELLMQAYDGATFNGYPEELYDWYKAYYMSQGIEESEIDENKDYIVENNINSELFYYAIAEAEGFTIEPEEIEAVAIENGFESAEDMLASYAEYEINNYIIANKVMDLLKETAVVAEETEVETELATELETELETEA